MSLILGLRASTSLLGLGDPITHRRWVITQQKYRRASGLLALKLNRPFCRNPSDRFLFISERLSPGSNLRTINVQ